MNKNFFFFFTQTRFTDNASVSEIQNVSPANARMKQNTLIFASKTKMYTLEHTHKD
jgi:hypothetical protein